MQMQTKAMTLAAIFAVLTAVAARIVIPLPVIPFSMQTAVWMLSGLLLGARLGAASQLLYIAMGLIGIPVFIGGGGPGYVFSPTFGYLIGSVACAWISGRIVEKRRERGKTPTRVVYGCAALTGLLAMYAIAVVYLYLLKNFWMPGDGMTFFRVLTVGFLTTIGPDLLKTALAAVVAERLHSAAPYLFRVSRAQNAA